MTSSSSYVRCRDFLDKVIEFEIESAAFYHRMVEDAPDAAVTDLLTLLERQEATHAMTLREFTPPDENAMIQFAPDLSALMPPAPDASPALAELIEIGIERERLAKEAYLSAARSVSGGFRELLEGLARFEEEHEDRLKSLCNM